MVKMSTANKNHLYDFMRKMMQTIKNGGGMIEEVEFLGESHEEPSEIVEFLGEWHVDDEVLGDEVVGQQLMERG